MSTRMLLTRTSLVLLLVVSLQAVTACRGGGSGRDHNITVGTTGSDGYGGGSGRYRDPRERSSLNVLGIEPADIEEACSRAVREMLANPLLNNPQRPPQVIIESNEFEIRSLSRVDKDLFVDRLRTYLVSAANGRMRFVSRESFDRIKEERGLEEEGHIGTGTAPSARRQLGADYSLKGRVTDLQNQDGRQVERLTQMNLEMIDMDTGELVFAFLHDFVKGQGVPRAYR